MDEELLNAFERAAKIYCRKVGIDPEEMLESPEQAIIGVRKLIPQWHFAVPHLHDLSLMLTSMREAAEEPLGVAH